jgi:hypothetical protein
LQKGWILCQEETEQGRAAKDVVVVEVWGEVKVEVEWEGRSPQDREEIVYAQAVASRYLILLGNHAIKEIVLSVVQE